MVVREPNLYAIEDNNRKPWYIVAYRSLGRGDKETIRDFRICHDQTEIADAIGEFRELYGLTACQVYTAEGYFNIQG